MEAFKALMATDVGILSMFTIVFIIGMGFFLYGFAKRQMAIDAKKAEEGKL